ncbi:hypothetical protein CQY20_15505 [Mycolicibacterium agri]|uniref:Lipoprotein LpqN n=1 Tax=Mycolicibacterium agri TaxID=36811 RepID=A0A2A7N2H3_MYCAG|nr:LpqN/LpqT family lipoprotein [Mycolicibacterium agri]PEG37628.1 hypothetical protein CQY20_15505 [Mycolicibacterium agri]GFG55628.1 hypothetical protein MAGR_70690 [Mycolicibacterium agri]
MTKLRAGGIAILAVALGLGLASCSSEEKKAEETTSATTSAADETSAPAAAPETPAVPVPHKTIPDYIKENGITETPVKRGDPGSPEINLTLPPGWEDLGEGTPPWAWAAYRFTGDPAMAENPPTITALLSKLQGNVDPAKILEFAPGEMMNLPGYEGGSGTASTLGGFDAWQIGGVYTRDDAKRAVAQKTVTIPGADGLFVLQVNAEGTEDQMGVLMDATSLIDEQTTITPAP